MEKKKKQKERFPPVGRNNGRGSDSLNWRDPPKLNSIYPSPPMMQSSSQFYHQYNNNNKEYNNKETPQDHIDNVQFLHSRWMETKQRKLY
jgi:hypothetical protein